MNTRSDNERLIQVIRESVPDLPIKVTRIVTEDNSSEFYGLRIDYNPGFYELLFVSNGTWIKLKNGEESSPLGVSLAQEDMLPYLLAYNWACSEIGTIDASKNPFMQKMNGLDAARVKAAKINVHFVQELLEEAPHDDGLGRIEKWTCKGMLKMLKSMAKASF
jgi:hypothetical protein